MHQIDTDAVFLLVHPCGELLLVSNTASGAARWDRACIRWIEERGVYWMCKYSVHDLKFELSSPFVLSSMQAVARNLMASSSDSDKDLF